ncbi:MAG TPA: hypothetical protein PLQ83_18365 [Thermoflexales bacterium]|nr:hypothetical protein [Thermoflexales bacterium]
MGQDEDAQPLMRRADFCRREQTRRRRVVHAPKLSQHGFKTEGDMPGDVFEEHPLGTTFPDNAGDLGPEMPGIVGTGPLPGRAEGLARISGENGIKRPPEGAGIEAPQIVPDWCRGEISCALGGNEDRSGPVFPLDKGPGVISGFGQHDAQIQAPAACAEGQSVPGT